MNNKPTILGTVRVIIFAVVRVLLGLGLYAGLSIYFIGRLLRFFNPERPRVWVDASLISITLCLSLLGAWVVVTEVHRAQLSYYEMENLEDGGESQ